MKFDDLTDTELPDVIFGFYTSVRREDGEMYKLQSLKCICTSINRYTKEKHNLDIIANTKFIKANEMFCTVIVQTKKEGKAVTICKPVIEDCDMKIIAEYFNKNHEDDPDPQLLQQNVIFNILYFFMRRGHENLPQMQWDWFKISNDPESGLSFVKQIHDELDKNYGPNDTKLTNQGRMYEQKGQ